MGIFVCEGTHGTKGYIELAFYYLVLFGGCLCYAAL